MSNALVSFELIPKTSDVIPYIDRAVQIIEASGVHYVVGPLDTMMEGDLAQLLNIVREVNEELAKIGDVNLSSIVKIEYNPKGLTMAEMTERYR